MSAYNHYDEAKEIASQLENEGFEPFATQIRDAMKRGATGTEIFMMLRACIKPLLNDAGLPKHTAARLRILYTKLDDALQ
jgi:hypothetical protein